MRILLILLFVSLFVLAGSGQKQTVLNTDSKVKCAFFADTQQHNHAVLKEAVYIDQDTNETNDFVLFFIEITASLKAVFLSVKPVSLFLHSFYHNHLSYFTTDLPPPANFLFF